MLTIRRVDEDTAAEEVPDLYLEMIGRYLLECEIDETWWWLAFTDTQQVAGFAGMRPYPELDPPCVFMAACGVLPAYRGQRLQRRFLRVREAAARKAGFSRCVTYTHNLNSHSANNLIAAGYRVYTPRHVWGLPNGIYLYKEVGTCLGKHAAKNQRQIRRRRET